MKTTLFGALVFSSFLLAACSSAGRDTLLGAGAGAAAGAAIGEAVADEPGKGAAIGGAVGAATGYGIHESQDDD